jgi:hypothetical protein
MLFEDDLATLLPYFDPQGMEYHLRAVNAL